MIHEGMVDSAVFITFLKRLLIGSEQPVFLIVGGHPVHKSAAVKRFVAEQNGRLKLFFLPHTRRICIPTNRYGHTPNARCRANWSPTRLR